MDYCANCDNEANVLLRITPKLSDKETALPLCVECKDAFDWGMTHAEDTIEEEYINQDTITEEV